MMTRPTLNGLTPRTARDTARDPFDWIECPPPHETWLNNLGHKVVTWVSSVGSIAVVAVLAYEFFKR